MRTERHDDSSGGKLRYGSAIGTDAVWWLIARNGAVPGTHRIEVLTVGDKENTGGEGALAVFSFREEAEMFLRLGGFGDVDSDGWRARESGAGELVSMLSGPCKDVMRVALDPMPEMLAETVDLASLSRERFLERITGPSLLPVS